MELKDKDFKRKEEENEETEENKQTLFVKLLFFTFKEERLISSFFPLTIINLSSVFTSSVSTSLILTFTPSSVISIILNIFAWIIFILSMLIYPPPSIIINE
jgi:hypothetical protein